MKPRLSIVMTTYNGARYVQEQLNSFAAQTTPPDELVVCDDNSSDTTGDILLAFKRIAPFSVRLYRNDRNLGCTRNFERAITLAEADIVFLSDQDDVWFPKKLETVVKYFQQYPEVLALTNDQELADARMTPTGQTTFGQFKVSGALGQPFAVGCCTAIRASLRPILLPLPSAEAHDVWLHNVVDLLGVRGVLPVVLQYHRRHDSNESDPRLNPMYGISAVEATLASWSSDPRETGLNRTKMLNLVEARLRSVAGSASATRLSNRLELALDRVLREKQAIGRRLQLYSHGRIGRFFLAPWLLFRGDYRYFRGWKSFLKDLLR